MLFVYQTTNISIKAEQISRLQAVAKKARSRGTGTRSLRSLMEALLHDAMYEAPALAAAGHASSVLLTSASVAAGSATLVRDPAQVSTCLKLVSFSF